MVCISCHLRASSSFYVYPPRNILLRAATVKPKTLTACICIPKEVPVRCLLSNHELTDVDLTIRMIWRSIGTNQEIIKLQEYTAANLDIENTMVGTLHSYNYKESLYKSLYDSLE